MELDNGESEAIALAIELKIQNIIMDESDGRSKARALGLSTIGVIGVLLRAKRDARLESLKQALLALRQEAGFFIADELYQHLLIEVDEATGMK